MKKSSVVVLSLLLLLSTGCTTTPRVSAPDINPVAQDWKQITSIFERRVLRVTHEGTSYELIAYKAAAPNVLARLGYQNPPKRLEEWAADLDAGLLINGGYFTEDYQPTGHFVYEGKPLAHNDYDAEKSATITIDDGHMHIWDTSQEKLAKNSGLSTSFQSYPVLIHRSGKTGVSQESEKSARRTVLAQDQAGNILIIVVDRTPITLFDLATILQQSDLDIAVAVNLDGGPSTALRAKFGGFQETVLPLTALPIVLRFAKPAAD